MLLTPTESRDGKCHDSGNIIFKTKNNIFLLVSLCLLLLSVIPMAELNAQGDAGEVVKSKEWEQHFVFSAGASIPLGTFAGEMPQFGGTPQIGFALEGALTLPVVEGFHFTVSANVNYITVNYEKFEGIYGKNSFVGPWILGWGSGGVGYHREVYQNVDFYVTGLAGVFVGASPALDATQQTLDSTYVFHQDSFISSTLGYGATLGIQYEKKYDFGIRFLYAKPEYDVFSKQTLIAQVFVGVLL